MHKTLVRKTAFIILALCLLSTQAFAQTPDATRCEPPVIDTPLAIVAGTTITFAFCTAFVADAWSIWIDGEPITLTGALQQSTNMSTTGLREYMTPKYAQALAVGRHVFSALVGTFNKATGKTDFASAPSMPRALMITAAPPPSNCAGQVRLSIGEAKPRVVTPDGEVEITFSLGLSLVPVTSMEIRLNGVAVMSGLIGPAPDMRGVGSFRFKAPLTEGDYSISMIAFGSNGCSDGVDRYIPITVKR